MSGCDCTPQGPGRFCTEGQRLYRDVCAAYERVLAQDFLTQPFPVREQQLQEYERLRDACLEHLYAVFVTSTTEWGKVV